MEEMWKDVLGFEGTYQVSNLGRVKSLDRIIHRDGKGSYAVKGKILSQNLQCKREGKGYYYVALWYKGKQHTKLVHRLIAEAFIPKEPDHVQVNHIDFNRLNNSLDNLEWVTPKENVRHFMEALTKANQLRSYKSKFGPEDL